MRIGWYGIEKSAHNHYRIEAHVRNTQRTTREHKQSWLGIILYCKKKTTDRHKWFTQSVTMIMSLRKMQQTVQSTSKARCQPIAQKKVKQVEKRCDIKEVLGGQKIVLSPLV